MKKNQIVIFWFRRDLRLEDNAGLHLALKSGFPVLPIFIFDKNILSKLQAKKDARVLFIHREIEKLKTKLEKMGSSLRTYFETPEEAWKKILDEYDVVQVFANRDYESYARERDNSVFSFLKSKGIAFHGSKDHVIFEKNEVLKENGAPYTVFTPYSKKWKSTLRATDYQLFSNKKYEASFLKCPPQVLHSMKEIGFEDFAFPYFPTNEIHHDLISSYHLNRNFPSLNGTTRLSMHLRFGTISLRSLVKIALNENETFLNELIWRDFYQMIIYHFPHSEKNSFKPAYDKIDWNNNPDDFKLWCEGRTGYPIVDAGMRELNETGFMHNRVRMIVASFLTKHLLIDWRWGERYFAEKLLDYELASNTGGWQWAAGCGCDAAPYFRVFNPTLQAEKFDPEKKYIRRWIPEFDTIDYAIPMIDHKQARERCLRVFKNSLNPA